MRRRPVVILIFALGCGGLSAHLGRQYLQSQVAAMPASARATTPVAVAARDLSGGAVLGAGDVRMLEWPAGMSPPGYVAESSILIGQELVVPIRANEPILQNKLAGAAVSGLAAVIPPGMRAVSVKVDEVIAVGGFAVPGSRVDVIATMPSEMRGPGVSRIVLQKLKVIAVGQTYEVSERSEPQDASVITLLVTPEQAEVLTLASTEGRIQLALRNTTDESRAQTRGTPAEALEGQATPAPRASTPAPSPARPRKQEVSVEIYHGTDRTVSSF